MKLRPATARQQVSLENAYFQLLRARDSLKAAGCPKTLAAVRRAISSAKGARRHMRTRAWKSAMPGVNSLSRHSADLS
jgi:hypothetical protein